MHSFIRIIILVVILFFIVASSCDQGVEGCTDNIAEDGCGDGCNGACNYNIAAVIDDNSCWYVNKGCDCDDPVGSTSDCLGVCDTDDNNNPDENIDGTCESGVIGGCIDSLICNYNENATHNDGGCAKNLSSYGGNSTGVDCNDDCDDGCSASELGDVNDDNSVNVQDIIHIVNFIMGTDVPTPYEACVADLNEDGSINVQDIILVVNIIMGN